MQTVTNGFQLNPSALLETAFQAIADGEMQDLPFFQPQIPVRACGFQLFERQWVGTILTPWMLSLLVLPGPEQVWQPHAVGDKLALSLPCGSVRFIVGEIAGCGQYLACSLMSPLDRHLGAEQALALAQQSARMALSLPVVDGNIPSNPGRRALFGLSQRTA
ncbi:MULTISPECIES: hydrogenase-2 assembly chaperone [Serratia]|jgi:[NiFe] hydrogenase assembly HybE family chaperone|uniref:Hydrogenase-2 assembly chaperone n=1 Tax=Serratia fonticola TaxID=47917 RepID=A0A1Q5VA68_SERFO|nr:MULTISPECIES: hydrogenase-2 assembly chaperone [Serratia]MBC3216392.1 hydrogenase-2 assembly chaperone [Serratia fonticola]MBE0151490.1 hydrogenase-2 assembly chaperone [Serratia fonticola]MDQ7207233.1 hydrogenase-2 assembly chaperone [Serratia fonticola]NBJ36517.1 hydrogenase-2 assembly chaperone [Serratia fonticola]OKP26348.1 hydrogenase [Serratia fonticola]